MLITLTFPPQFIPKGKAQSLLGVDPLINSINNTNNNDNN